MNKKTIKKKKYDFGGPVDPITGLPTFTPTGDLTGNIWNIPNGNAPVNPNTNPDAVIPLDQRPGTPVAQGAIAPLSQFYDINNIGFGNKGLRPTGQYVNDQGQTRTVEEQQAIADNISQDNRLNADQGQTNRQNVEKVSSLSIAAINAFLGKNNSAKQSRKNTRDAMTNDIFNPTYNPYAEGTGSQAIFKKGGKMIKKYPDGGEVPPGSNSNQYRDPYYEASARLAYFKGQLNDKLKAKNPAAYDSYFKGLRGALTAPGVKNPDQARREYVQKADWNEFLSPDEVKNTLGDKYNTYLDSLKQVNTYNVAQGLQPLYGDVEGENDITKLNYGRRFASLQVTPSVSSTLTSKNGDVSYNRQYTYDPNTNATSFTESGDLKAMPRYLRPKPVANNQVATLAKGGEIEGVDTGIQTFGGGKAKVVSNSDHSHPMIEFVGKEHKEGGIDVAFGGTIAEVENKELGFVDDEGSLNIFGKLKLPGTGTTFKKAAKDIADQESKVDRTKEKYLTILNNSNIASPYQQTAQSTAKVMFKSLDKQSKQIAEKKEALASYQNLILSMTEDSDKMAYGGKMPRKPKKYAEGGDFGPPIDTSDAKAVQEYIDKVSGGKSPLKAEDFIEVSTKYGVPLDLMLAQATQESRFGTQGRAVRTKNIFNVGNTDDGTESNQGDWKAGLERYAQVIKNEYAKDPSKVSTQEILNNNFVRPGKGGRYATDPNYTTSIAGILDEINPDNTYSFINSGSSTGSPTGVSGNGGLPTVGNGGSTTNSANQGTGEPLNDPGRVGTDGLLSFVPKYAPLAPDKNVPQETPYGPAFREPPIFSDKATVGVGQKERGYQSPLAVGQIAPELLALATNKRDTVAAPTFQPELQQTFDISYQLGRNQNQSTFNQLASLATQAGSTEALSQLAAQKYQADQQYTVQEIQGNAQQKLQTYNQNTNTLNQAQQANLQILDNQMVRQAQSKFNTQSQNMAAFKSIAAKDQQNKLENRTYNAYANLFKHYGFDKKGNVTFDPDRVAKRFTPGEQQAFGLMSAQQGASAIMNGDYSRKFTKVKNNDGSTTTTETLGDNKKIQEEYKALKSQGFDDMIIGNMLRAKYPETINND